MRIVNETRDCVLADRAEVATRIMDRMRGLLGRDGLEPGTGLVIEPCNSIHTFFMRFPIAVLFLDDTGEIVRAFDEIPPWRLTRVYASARRVVELPAGRLTETGTSVGDRILLLAPTGGARADHAP